MEMEILNVPKIRKKFAKKQNFVSRLILDALYNVCINNLISCDFHRAGRSLNWSIGIMYTLDELDRENGRVLLRENYTNVNILGANSPSEHALYPTTYSTTNQKKTFRNFA